jgi:tetratricopeptide (TPR) repeat protein
MKDEKERWAKLEALFDGALEQPEDRRAEWARAAAGDDAALCAEVLAMLAAHQSGEGVLDRPLPQPALPSRIPPGLEEAVADRYILDERIGEGGMAAVFLAHERKHDRKVVIKVLKPEIAAWFGARRFRTEVELAARLSHPHILGLIDSGQSGGYFYYVMPYVGGDTLRARLRSQGPLELAEAVTLLRDVADAMAYAHRSGVIHRDVKPENILCVGGHAFLMDFGIARFASSMAGGTTKPGVVLGTPGYMAPEQQDGRTVDHRTDIWSWGVVAREALLGDRAGDKPLTSRRDVPDWLAGLVEQCLSAEPSARPDNAEYLVQLLEAHPVTGPEPARTPGGLGWLARRRWWIVTALVLVVAAGFLWRQTRPPVIPAGSLGTLAVAPLRNETGDSTLATWGRLAGDWITQGLQQTGRVTVVSWPAALDAAERAAADDGAGLVKTVAAETQAQTVVTGSYYLVDDRLRFQAEIVDARTGALLGAVAPVEVDRAAAVEGVRRLRDRMMGMLATRTDERFEELPEVLDLPPTYEAYRSFDRGIRLYNSQQYDEAALAMREAWNLDTAFLVPLVYAATAHWNRGEPLRTDSLVRWLAERRNRLSPYLEYTLNYVGSLLAGEGEAAFLAARQAVGVAPGGRAAYNAGRLALMLNRPAEALSLLQGLDPDRGLMRGWQSYWTQLTHALHLNAAYDRELEAVLAMRRRFPESRVATVLQARVLAATGRLAALDSLLREIEPLSPDTYWSQGAAMVVAAEEILAHGQGSARPYTDRAVRWLANQLARDPSNARHRYWLGTVLYDAGRWRDAEPYFESLAQEFPDNQGYRAFSALVTAHLGDTTAALRRLGSPPPYDRGEHTAYRARIAAIGGDKDQAIELLTEALHRGIDGWAWRHADARQEFKLLEGDPRFERLMKGDLPN